MSEDQRMAENREEERQGEGRTYLPLPEQKILVICNITRFSSRRRRSSSCRKNLFLLPEERLSRPRRNRLEKAEEELFNDTI